MQEEASKEGPVAVVGAGGYGLYLLYLLREVVEGGVVAITRENSIQQLARSDNKCNITGCIETTCPIVAHTFASLPYPSLGTVFITTKIGSVQQVLKDMEPKIGPHTNIVLCQNGVGVYDLAKEVLPEGKGRLFRMGCWFGVEKKAANHIHLAGVDKFILGGHADHAEFMELWKGRMNKALEGTTAICEVLPDPHLVEWKKTLWNITFNALLSVSNVKNGAVLQYQDLRSIAEMILKEACEIAALEGIELTEKDQENVFRSIAKTAANTNSSLQDLYHGEKTEVEYFNGSIARIAAKHGRKAPLNEAMHLWVKFLEESQIRKQ